MSCEKCEEIQEENLKGKKIAYIRIGRANVAIGACDEHFNMLQRQLGLEPTVVHRIIDLNKINSKTQASPSARSDNNDFKAHKSSPKDCFVDIKLKDIAYCKKCKIKKDCPEGQRISQSFLKS